MSFGIGEIVVVLGVVLCLVVLVAVVVVLVIKLSKRNGKNPGG